MSRSSRNELKAARCSVATKSRVKGSEVVSTATVGRAAGWDDESTSVRVCKRRSGASVGPSLPLLVRKRRFAIFFSRYLLGLRLTLLVGLEGGDRERPKPWLVGGGSQESLLKESKVGRRPREQAVSTPGDCRRRSATRRWNHTFRACSRVRYLGGVVCSGRKGGLGKEGGRFSVPP